MSHGWCDPSFKSLKKENKKEKRSISTILATIFALGSLIIGPAIGSVLLEISHNTKWRITELRREMETAHLLIDLEKRITANAKVEEILASIFLHESIMSDLLQHSDNKELNRTWKRILKYQIKEYVAAGFTKNTVEEVLGSAESLLPKGTYKIEATVHKNKDCGETKITIKAVGLVPDKSCLRRYIDQGDEDDITRLQTNTPGICIFAGKESTLLADNSTFITSNTIVGPCNNTATFEFRIKENTILVRPKSSRGYMSTSCTKGRTRKFIKKILYRDRLYVLPIHCNTWISNEKKRTINPQTDYLQSEEIFISATDGKETTAGTTHPTMLFFAVEEVKDLGAKDKVFLRDKNYLNDFLDSIASRDPAHQEETDNIKIRTLVTVLTVLVLGVVMVIFCRMRKRIKSIPYLTIKYLRGEEPKKDDDVEERTTEAAEHEFVRLLMMKDTQGDEQKGNKGETETMEGESDEYGDNKPTRFHEKHTDGQREKGMKTRTVTIHEEPSNSDGGDKIKHEQDDSAETHYDLPRILFGTNETQREKKENNKGTTEKESTDKHYDTPKALHCMVFQEYLDDVTLVRTTPQIPKKRQTNKTDISEGKKKEEGGKEEEETIQKNTDEGEKTEQETHREVERSTENIYETITFDEDKADIDTNSEPTEECLKKEPESSDQKKIHDRMLEELLDHFLIKTE